MKSDNSSAEHFFFFFLKDLFLAGDLLDEGLFCVMKWFVNLFCV